ncbi:MAG: hypothetical protein AAGC63_11555 [Propionicimonas sp.]
MKGTIVRYQRLNQGGAHRRLQGLSITDRLDLTDDARRDLARRGTRVGVTKPTVKARKAARRRRTRSA